MSFDHDLHAVANGISDLLEHLEAAPQLPGRQVVSDRAHRRPTCRPGAGKTVDLRGKAIPGPHLHRAESLIAQFPGEGTSVLEPGLLIAVRAYINAGRVSAHPVPAAAAQKSRDGLSADVADEIPERDVNSRERPHLRTRVPVEVRTREQGLCDLGD